MTTINSNLSSIEPFPIYIYHMWQPTGNCAICDKEISLNYFLPMWCELIVPDELLDTVEWGGIPVCKECCENPPQERFMKI